MSWTRELPDHAGYSAGCCGAPPPLNIIDENPAANWHPLPSVPAAMMTQPPGPQMIYIPNPSPFGDDPTDPAQQTKPRIATAGMIGRLNLREGR